MVIKNRIIMKVFYYIICAACFAGCVSSSNDKTVKENGRTLHNGIVLPEQWPPSMIDDGVRREMSLPYISNKPTVISVNLGRQLFVDDFLIAETDMERVSHKAMFYGSVRGESRSNPRQCALFIRQRMERNIFLT